MKRHPLATLVLLIVAVMAAITCLRVFGAAAPGTNQTTITMDPIRVAQTPNGGVALTGGVYHVEQDGKVLSNHTQFKEAVQAATNLIVAPAQESTTAQPVQEPTTTPTQSKKLGINLSPIAWYSRAWVFANLMRQAGQEEYVSDDGQTRVWEPFDGAWRLYTIFFAVTHKPKGTYLATWKGDGEVAFRHAAKANGAIHTLAATGGAGGAGGGTHYQTVTVTPDSTLPISVRLRGNVTDMALWTPAVVPSTINDTTVAALLKDPPQFDPLFLKRLAPFGTLRFMDWQMTNSSKLAHWTDRPTPDQYFGTNRDKQIGVALETMIDLCNTLHANPWFCIPHLADDDFVRRFAQMVKDRLDPSLKVYVEYSNETWNYGFGQTQWLKQQAIDDGIGKDDVVREVAIHCKHVWDIWLDVFGNESGGRVIRVAAGQEVSRAYEARLTEDLYELAQASGDATGGFDAISGAIYFYAADGDTMTSWWPSTWDADTTPDEMLDAMSKSVDAMATYYQDYGKIAAEYSAKLGRPIPYIAYEGGQSIAPRDKPGYDAYVAAQRDPRMGELYARNLANFEKAGGSMACIYGFVRKIDKNGAWNVLEYMDQPLDKAPKYQALVDWGAK